MDEQNCIREFRGIERNIDRDNTHVEMVVQEAVVLIQKSYSHQHEI